MNREEISRLDPRAKWELLPRYGTFKDTKINLSEDDLKILCLQPCSVYMHKFNVLTRISEAYNKDCRESNTEPNERTRIELYKEKGLKIYKKFYEPRLLWYANQRKYFKYLRQKEICYKTVIKNLNQSSGSKTFQSTIFVHDSFPDVNSEDFSSSIMPLPPSFQSTQVRDNLAIVDLINQL